MIPATSIELFKNLAQYNYKNQYFDLHNDFVCEKLFYSDRTLAFLFKARIGSTILKVKFIHAEICLFEFSNVKEVQNLTLDNLYRGRVEDKGTLIEIDQDTKGYFYLEFYEGQKLEFWAKSLDVEIK